MALTPEKIKAMEAATGLKYSGPSSSADPNQSASKSRADEIRAMAAKSPNASFVDTLSGRIAQPKSATSFQGAEVAQPLVTQPEEVVKGVIKGIPGQAASVTKGIESLGKGAMGMVGLDTAGTGLDYGPVEELTAPSNEAQELGYVGAGLLPIERGMTAAKPVVEAGLPVVKKGLEIAGDVLGAVKNKVIPRNPLAVKADAEILATPVEKLSKLTPTQRTRYFELQSEKATEEYNAAQQSLKKQVADTENKIATESKSRIEALKEEAKQLDYDLGQKSVEEAQSLKPKVIESMRKNSDEYRRLVDEEINPVRETYVDDDLIIQSIKNKFPNDPYSPDPYKADRLISEMGLKAGSTRKVGELYDAVKAERAGMSSGARKGTKTFSASDMDVTDRISVLSDALKESGVDLKNANQFWRNYAPMRDKLVKSVQPFTPTGAEGGSFNTFTNMIKTSLTKPDPKNANFIKATEDMLGVKIGNTEVRAAFEKLSQNQKAQVAAIAEKEAKLLEQKTLAETTKVNIDKKLDESKKALKLKEVTAQQEADSRRRVRSAIGAVIGGGATIGAYNALFGN